MRYKTTDTVSVCTLKGGLPFGCHYTSNTEEKILSNCKRKIWKVLNKSEQAQDMDAASTYYTLGRVAGHCNSHPPGQLLHLPR